MIGWLYLLLYFGVGVFITQLMNNADPTSEGGLLFFTLCFWPVVVLIALIFTAVLLMFSPFTWLANKIVKPK